MKGESIYEVIYYFQKQKIEHTYIPSAFHLLNCFLHILIYLSLPSIQLNNFIFQISSPGILIAFSVLMLVLVFQILIMLAKKKEFYLFAQMLTARFIISPLLTFISLDLYRSSTISSFLCFMICLMTQIISYVLSQLILFQTYRIFCLKSDGSSIVTQMVNFQMLLISLELVANTSIQQILVLILFITSVRSVVTYFDRKTLNIQFNILYMIRVVHLALSLLLVFQNSKESQSVSISNTVVMVMAIVYVLIKRWIEKKNIKLYLRKVMKQQATYLQFVDVVDYFVQLMKQKTRSSQIQLNSFIITVVFQHGRQCSMPYCQLSTNSTQEEMQNLSSKAILQLTLKIQKKFEWVFQYFYHQDCDNHIIAFDLLKYHSYCVRNRIKLHKLLAEIDVSRLDWGQTSQYYKMQQIYCDMEKVQNIEAIKIDEDVIQFQSCLLSALTFMQEFWAQFFEERVDLKRIMQIASKIFPFKDKIENIFQENIKEYRYSSYQILTLYALYLRMILNQQEMSLKVQDYIKLLTSRLKENQDLKYLSKETESGFIVISLSETKLGSIILMNEKACNIFKYTKKQILSKNVNIIMPQVFGVLHDKILTDFLKTRRQKFNTDQRLLFGKDGNGFMFPLQLKLQSLTVTNNDEFIFIANVKPEKTKKIPIYCIVDHEGYIKDSTASFKYLFYKKSKKKMNKNIQEIVVNYFDEDFQEDSTLVRQLQVPIENKKIGNVDALFTIFPLVVKGNHQGFLIKMTYQQAQSHIDTSMNFTEKIINLRLQDNLTTSQVSYNTKYNCFELNNKVPFLRNQTQQRQFTLPFMQFQDMVLFAQEEKALTKTYGVGIKTIRYVRNHFERIEQESSFHSESLIDEQGKDFKTKISEMKENSQKKQAKNLIKRFTITINIFLVLILLVLVSIYILYSIQVKQEIERFDNFEYNLQVRYSLPEYIIYFTLYNANINSTYYHRKMVNLQTILVSCLINSPLPQLQKQQILQIIFLRTPKSIVQLMNSEMVNFNVIEDSTLVSLLRLFWGSVIFISILMVIAMFVIISSFKNALFRVYSIFLSLKQPAIRHIYLSCKKLIEMIKLDSIQNKRNVQENQLQKLDEQQNQIEKIKQFKNKSRVEDLFYLLKMGFPLIFLITLSLVIMLLSISSFNKYLVMKQEHDRFFQSIPAISIQFMKSVVKTVDNVTLNVSTDFFLYYQQIQKNMISFQESANHLDFSSKLYGNACFNTKVIPDNQRFTCTDLQNGILKYGISSAVNYLSEQIGKISVSTSFDAANLLSLLQLQYLFVNPILVEMEDMMKNSLIDEINRFGFLYELLTIVAICFIIVYDLYLYFFPITQMEHQINFTNGMITLLPQNPLQVRKITKPI